jgi:hypothetical protein
MRSKRGEKRDQIACLPFVSLQKVRTSVAKPHEELRAELVDSLLEGFLIKHTVVGQDELDSNRAREFEHTFLRHPMTSLVLEPETV